MRTRRSRLFRSRASSPRWLSARRLAAAVLAAGALLLAISEPLPGRAAPVRESRSVVLVAARDLAAGRTITADDLRSAERTTAQLPDGVLSIDDDVSGRVITGPVRRGEIITDLRLLGPGLSAGLAAGDVASPIRLLDLDVAALLRPGDRVDILAATADATTATVVAASALVLAVPRAESEGSPVARPPGLVVLGVSQETAGRLAAAAGSSGLTATLLPP